MGPTPPPMDFLAKVLIADELNKDLGSVLI